jgi:hypothetical protein
MLSIVHNSKVPHLLDCRDNCFQLSTQLQTFPFDALRCRCVGTLHLFHLFHFCQHSCHVSARHVFGVGLLTVSQHLPELCKLVMFGHILTHHFLVLLSESVYDVGHTVDESVHGLLCLFQLFRHDRRLVYLV